MRVLSLILVPGVMAFALSTAKADPIVDPTQPAPGAMAPNTTDTPGVPAPAPATTDDVNAAPPVTPAPAPADATNNITVVPSPPPSVQPVEPVPMAPVAAVPVPEGTYYPGARIYSRIGVGMLVGGGFEDFVNSGIRNSTGDGGYWTARVVAGTREFLGLEAAYVGDARGISGLGLSSDSRLVSNGLEGNLRVNIPIIQGPSLIEPFGFVGLGWSHYVVTNNNAALSDFTSRDDVMTLPFGGGLEFAHRGFLADARFTYRQTYFNNLTETVGGTLNSWGVGGQIGFEY
jgi:hypothetical protein